MDQLPSKALSSLSLEASKQRMGDHLGIPVAGSFSGKSYKVA